ncbi:MAG: ABC transporter permease [Gemmatimonadetes bacterium]|nr:ABC transporter permease [Gemmatimonadota bacterium]
MSTWRSKARKLFRVGRFMGTDAVEHELDQELRFHVESTIEALIEEGLSAEEARAEATRRFGDLGSYAKTLAALDKQRVRRQSLADRVAGVRQTIRHAARSLGRSPALSIGIIATFALGIGANATMFSVIDRLLLRPPDGVRDADQIRRVLVEREFMGRRVTQSAITYPDLQDLTAARAFEEVAGVAGPRSWTMGYGVEARGVSVEMVSGSYFHLLGAEARLGRLISPEDDDYTRNGVAVLSHSAWTRHFGRDPDVLGRELSLDSGRFIVIGVAAEGFNGIDLSPIDIWIPLKQGANLWQSGPWETERGFYFIEAIGRLAPGSSDEAAEVETTLLHRRGRAEDPRYDRNAVITLAPIQRARGPWESGESVVARWLGGVAMIVLLIAAANVANLLLARGLRRRREVAVRLALGISRGRLIGFVAAEGLILAVMGGVAALAVAEWGGRLITSLLLEDVYFSQVVTGRVVLFTFAVSILAALLSTLLPALQASRPDLVQDLRSGNPGEAPTSTRIRKGLLVVQVAFSVVLLVGAGLFVRSLSAVAQVDLGVEPRGLVTVSLDFGEDPAARPQGTVDAPPPVSSQEATELYQLALERLRALPLVRSASVSAFPIFTGVIRSTIRVAGADSIPISPYGGPYINWVDGEYLRTAGISLLAGRDFQNFTPGDAPVMVVSQLMADVLWPGESALGKCVYVGNADDPPCSEVIGVAEEFRRSVTSERAMQYFVPLSRRSPREMLVRVDGDAEAALGPISEVLRGLDPRIRFSSVGTMEQRLDPQTRSWRMGATLFSVFGLLALIVAAVGLYSMLSFGVEQRTREMGVRWALGASVANVASLVLGESLRLTAFAIALGLALSVWASRFVGDLLFEVSPTDPKILAGAGGLLMCVAMVAALGPSLRMARLDPLVVLRSE